MTKPLLEAKYNILKLRISNLIEEHAEALALVHQYAEKVKQLEEEIQKNNVEEKQVEPSKN